MGTHVQIKRCRIMRSRSSQDSKWNLWSCEMRTGEVWLTLRPVKCDVLEFVPTCRDNHQHKKGQHSSSTGLRREASAHEMCSAKDFQHESEVDRFTHFDVQLPQASTSPLLCQHVHRTLEFALGALCTASIFSTSWRPRFPPRAALRMNDSPT